LPKQLTASDFCSMQLSLKNGGKIVCAPLPLANTSYPYIALLNDSMTVETCQPGGPFEEVKSYFDVKNGIYGIKKEVTVSAHPPHYALFISPYHHGSGALLQQIGRQILQFLVIQPILVIQVRRQAFGALPFKDIHWSCQISVQQHRS